jgi:hypothetical protein
MTCRIVRPAVFAALLGLAGCVGEPTAYGPPPGYGPPGYAARRGEPVALGATCSAGAYTCALPQARPLGTPCSCPGLGAPSYGNVR